MRSYHAAIDSSLDAVPPVGTAVRALCRESGLSEGDAAMVELGLVEALNNSIEHACCGIPGYRIEVSLSIGEHHLEARIVDDGPPIDLDVLTASRAPSFDIADRLSLPEGGFGVSLIRTVFDEVSFRRDGKTNVLSLQRKRVPHA